MLVLPNPQLAVQTALQSFPEQSVVHLNWLKNPQIIVLRKKKCFIKYKGFPFYRCSLSPLLWSYGHSVQLWSEVHVCGGHGGEDEGEDAEDFHGEAVTMIVPSWPGWQLI